MGKREDIMQATLDLIDEIGLQSVTIAKIMKQAGVGSGTLFNYFSTKDELINEVYRAARARMAEYLLMGYEADSSLYERFKCLQLNRLRFAMACRKEYMFIDSYSYSPSILPEIRNEDESGVVEEMRAVILEGQRQGLIREMDPGLCHQIMHGIISSVVKGYFVHKYPFDEQQIRQTLEASWRSISV